ncbi:MAG: hypothetical protein M1839_006831 [Geoglossum umbratile]|nr:MAG: hypothetical protein M1839_006831 [Geoglossum umbratile]
MHKFRSEARKHAWYSERGNVNYNPFCRARFQRRHDGQDEENIANHSDSCIPGQTGSNDLARSVEGDFSLPDRAITVPMVSGAIRDASLGSDMEVNSPPISDKSRPLVEKPSVRKRLLGTLGRGDTMGQEVARAQTTESTKRRRKFTFWGQIRATVFSSWINILFVFAPAGIIVNYLHVSPVVIFVVNFIAIIPLAAMLSYATEELALRVGETLGGLLNATFGNAVELIVSILALIKHEVLIVQTSLIGSILSNLLLVLGMCFFAGGLTRLEQFFNVTVAQTASSLLALSVGSLIIPTAFHSWSSAGDAGITELSRGTAIILLTVYGCYLFFQLKSHSAMYNEPSPKAEPKRGKVEGSIKRGVAAIGRDLAGGIGGQNIPEHVPVLEEEEVLPELSILTAFITLAISTALVAICAEFMVGSIDALSASSKISKNFIGLILIPIVGNAAEHATAITVAIKDKMDLAIGVAVGSSMQIALLVIPLVVVIGWIMHIDEMTLYFDGFQIAVLFVAVLLVNYLIQDGKSHWLEGVLLMSTYLIISIAAWFYPAREDKPH